LFPPPDFLPDEFKDNYENWNEIRESEDSYSFHSHLAAEWKSEIGETLAPLYITSWYSVWVRCFKKN